MAALDIHHVTINTADLDASVAFYNDIIGAETVHRPDLGYPGAWLQLGSTMFHFNGGDMAKSRDGKVHRGGGAVDHVALRAHDLPRLQPLARLGALAVDPHLAGAQELFEPAMAEAGEMTLEPAVEPKLGLVFADGDGGDAAHAFSALPSP